MAIFSILLAFEKRSYRRIPVLKCVVKTVSATRLLEEKQTDTAQLHT